MAYIGNQPTSAAFLTDQFSGNGSTVAFTMSVAPANTASIIVAISGVVQDPTTYSVNATTLTFSAAPPSGIGNISVRYLGLPATGVTTTAYRTVTEFTATAGQTVFAVPSYTVGYIDVYRNGVRLGTTDYTATNGTSVTLLNAASAGDLVVTESFYVSSVLNAIPAQAGQVGSSYLAAGAASQAFLDVGAGTGTGAFLIPSGTTAQRPSVPISGMQRWNTTIGGMELYVGSSGWITLASNALTVDYIVVAGGGGGGFDVGGGGGGGGVIAVSSFVTSPGVSYSVIVGAGGAGASTSAVGTSGSNSTFNSTTTLGGGGGGSWQGIQGANGGSGGGGGANNSGTTTNPGAGTTGQGYAGGVANGSGWEGYARGGGGGGAGAAGDQGNGTAAGGIGLLWVNGSYYGGGGGGNSNNNTYAGPGGLGGGGAGNASGTANTGGGGGGGGTPGTGGSGGSGIVIVRYPGSSARATGGTVTLAGGYVYHTFTSSGSFIA